MRLSAGARLGPYEVQSSLGAGGMGEVYKARDTRLNRIVAIKALAAHLEDDPDLRQRFLREAQAVAALEHPHICVLHDIGHHEGTDFLVMEFLEGETLAARLAKGPLPLDQVLRYAVEIVEALDKAHRRGIVHRDLKPGNIMLTKGGAKLLDFGLAKLRAPYLAGVAQSVLATQSTPLTAEGTILGTLQYMAPEQLEVKETDARTDIFAFGAVLYELVTGRKAFAGASQASIIAAILEHDPTPPSTLQPAAPPALDRVIKVCLAKDPDERWQSTRDLKRALAWIAEGGLAGAAAPARTPGKGRERAAWVLAAFGVAAAAVAIGVAALYRAPATAPAVRFAVYPPPDVDFALFGTSGSRQLAVSPDGRYVAFAASRAGAPPQLWLRALDSISAAALPGTEDASFPFWSPDSRSIGFFAERKLKRIDVSGSQLQALCNAPNHRGGAWGRDGVIVFAPNSHDSLYVVPASGGVPTPITSLDRSRQELTHRFPSFLPDGRRFLYLVRAGGDTGIYAGSIDSKEPRRVLSTGLSVAYVSPGYLLFVREQSLMAQSFNAATLQLTGEPTAIAEPLGGSSIYYAAFSASENGVLAYASGTASTGRLTWFDRGGKPLGTVGPPADYVAFKLSPDQKRMVVASTGPVQNQLDIWLLDIVRNILSRLTHDPLTDADPLWSPDGSRLVFRSDRAGTDDLYLRASSGEGPDEPFLTSPLGKFPTGWSSDGRFITFHASSETGWDLWTLSVADRKPTPFLRTQFTEMQGRLSPDGRWMAYASDESGVMEVYVRSFPAAGDKSRVSTGGGSEPQWRADGRELFYMAPDRKLMSAPVKAGPTFEAGAPAPLFETEVPALSTPYRNSTYAATADGQRFLVNTAVKGAASTPINIVLNWTAAVEK